MSNLTKRILTGVFGLIFVMGCLYYSPWTLMALFGLIAVFGLWEYIGLVDGFDVNKHRNLPREKFTIAAWGGIVYLLISLIGMGYLDAKFLMLLVPIFFLLFVKELFAHAPSPFIRLSLNLAGIVYIAVPCALINVIANSGDVFSPNRILGILLLIWANDTMAYFTGRQFGKTPLYKRISPKKTWEGSIGGAVGTFIVAFALTQLLPADFSPALWYGIAAITTVFGGIGDLVESMLKRSLSIKDSGNILPGHGGILDRFDAILFSVPFVFALVYLW